MSKASVATVGVDGSCIQHVSDGCGPVERLSLVISPTDEDELDRLRHRNASGSLSSHDYEDIETSSGASMRSTPTYEHQRHLCTQHSQQQHQHGLHLTVHSPRFIAPPLDFEDCTDYPCCSPSDRGAGMQDGTMHWKEISAALALTTLANSRLKLQTRLT